jgi:hypothetical protein
MVRCESCSSTIGHISLDTKQTGAPSAGNPHAGCDVAGAGNGFTVWLLRHSQRKRGETARLDLRNTAPVLDPTGFSLPIRSSSSARETGFAEICPDPSERANPHGQVDDKRTIQTCGSRSVLGEVAVGTIIADRPPHRSARALISACGSYLG